MWEKLFEIEELARDLALHDSLYIPTRHHDLLRNASENFKGFLEKIKVYPNFNEPNDRFLYDSNGINKDKGLPNLRLFDL